MKVTFRSLAAVLLVCLILCAVPAQALDMGQMFSDVRAGDWYCEAAYYVNDYGLMQGTSARAFSPNLTTTRAMVVTILYRIDGASAGADNKFPDVKTNDYFAKPVTWASANGVVSGYANGRFGPNDPITREQLAAILYRYAAYKHYNTSGKADLKGFTDASKISDYARDAMAWANRNQLITGVSARTLSPRGSATRAQVAAIFMRFREQFLDPSRPNDPNAVWVLTKTTDDSGVAELYHYDKNGNLTIERHPAENKTYNYAYSANKFQSFENGKPWETDEYNSAGQRIKSTNHFGNNYRLYDYDANGNLIKERFYTNDAHNATGLKEWTDYTYDQYGREVTMMWWLAAHDGYSGKDYVIYPQGNQLSEGEYNYYDSQGRLVKTTGIDEKGRPVSDSQLTTYSYDSNGNLVKVTSMYGDMRSEITYAYNSADQLIKETRAGNGSTSTISYTYDAYGNVIREVMTSAYGTTTTSYTYKAIVF